MGPVQIVLAFIALAAVSTAVIWKASGWLEAASERLATYYDLPPVIQGAVVVAIGSSFPELSTVIFSTVLHGEFELGIAAVVGSALFNVMIIPALSSLTSDTALNANRDIVYKEAQFYMIAVAVLLLVFSFAVIYHPVDGVPGALDGMVTRSLAVVPLIMYGVYVFVQYQDTIEYSSGVDNGGIALGHEWMRLTVALGAILLGVEGLIRAAIGFGDVLGTPNFLWGVTVVAAGTSIPDAFVSIRAARSGNAIASVANVLGSNIFDLLVCIPAGVMIAGAVTVNYSIAAPLMGVLTVATVIVFLMMRTNLVLTRPEAWILIGLYTLFIVWMCVETFDVVDLVPSLPPPPSASSPQ
ncbi:sodium:calcium antiporter [Longibacter salinarum]|uniref:Sodium:calcium antiporter n=1 Tax=Longibacter salinarum TaxID=1850348 RepID=A0A2A8D1T4_9BACT|nr:sodium:calcium antiporter [Longibacter salinarum]PEN14895.1 sodium:calcium antiporter [Longibacter salinarum]